MSVATSKIVAVVLSPTKVPKLHEVRHDVLPRAFIAGEWFEDSGLGDWQGFYDWLVTPEGRVIGVRQWLDERSKYTAMLATCLHVRAVGNANALEIFFGETRQFDPELSSSQDFGGNKLLVGLNALALTFNSPDEPLHRSEA